jgi:hypothetical protein
MTYYDNRMTDYLQIGIAPKNPNGLKFEQQIIPKNNGNVSLNFSIDNNDEIDLNKIEISN